MKVGFNHHRNIGDGGENIYFLLIMVSFPFYIFHPLPTGTFECQFTSPPV